MQIVIDFVTGQSCFWAPAATTHSQMGTRNDIWKQHRDRIKQHVATTQKWNRPVPVRSFPGWWHRFAFYGQRKKKKNTQVTCSKTGFPYGTRRRTSSGSDLSGFGWSKLRCWKSALMKLDLRFTECAWCFEQQRRHACPPCERKSRQHLRSQILRLAFFMGHHGTAMYWTFCSWVIMGPKWSSPRGLRSVAPAGLGCAQLLLRGSGCFFDGEPASAQETTMFAQGLEPDPGELRRSSCLCEVQQIEGEAAASREH